MKRVAIAFLAVLTGAPVALATAGAPPPAPPHARLRGFQCQTALDPAARAFSITSVMRPLPGTAHMQVRFELLRRLHKGAPAAPVKGGDLGTWISPSNPTLGQQAGDVWILHHPVINLAAPALYRFRVTFRWIGADGKEQGRVTHESRRCYQPELRPNLVVSQVAITTAPGFPGDYRYVATLSNTGRTAAGPFDTRLAVNGQTPIDRQVAGLAPHATTSLVFREPACVAGTPTTVTADSGDQIDVVDRASTVVTVSCPTMATPASGRYRHAPPARQ